MTTEIKELLESLGGAASVARRIGVTRQAVYQWHTRVPEASAWRLLRAFPEIEVEKLAALVE